MANTHLGVSTTSSGTRTKWTTSFWVKRCATGAEHTIFGSYLDNDNKDKIAFDSSNRLQFASFQAAGYSNGGNLVTNRTFVDCNAWYHIVCRWDTSNATADNRMKIWVNGVEETSFSSRTNPSSGRESLINYTTYTRIGSNGSPGNYLDGVLSHVHFCDNQLYQASDFGEYDTNGVWKIKTSPSVSYGTTGYFILKDGNSLTDQSGLGNDFSLQGGTLTNTEDNPSNVFATLNPLLYEARDNTFSNGNNTVTNAGANDWSNHYGSSTLAMSSGKWYVEAKVVTRVGSQAPLGIISTSEVINSSLQDDGRGAVISSGEIAVYGSVVQSGLTAIASGDIIGAAFDATNGTLQFYRNGSTYGSQLTSIPSGEYYFTCNSYDGGQIAFNFGNGYFSTTAVASAGTNASGIGIFEYDVPTGYTALSTKGLNE